MYEVIWAVDECSHNLNTHSSKEEFQCDHLEFSGTCTNGRPPIHVKNNYNS